MWRWMTRLSAVFLFSTLFLASTASAQPQFYDFGVPGVSIGAETPYYYPGYVYPGYAYPGYVDQDYAYPGFAYSYPEYVYGYAWRDGHLRYYNRYGDGGRYVRPSGPVDWHGDRDR